MHPQNNTQTVTMSFFRYEGRKNKTWGMSQMQLSRKPMKAMEGLLFFKPLGTGGGTGYSIWPDFGVYGLLAVWENYEQALNWRKSDFFKTFETKSKENYTIFMSPLSSRGSWSGFSNWETSDQKENTPLICIITRATIRKRFMFKFWSMVPGLSAAHDVADGLIFSKGIGEVPLLEQATFTIWENTQSMINFAYKSFHAEAVQITRKRNGFNEEMFTRLKPFLAVGSWKGINPLEKYGINSTL